MHVGRVNRRLLTAASRDASREPEAAAVGVAPIPFGAGAPVSGTLTSCLSLAQTNGNAYVPIFVSADAQPLLDWRSPARAIVVLALAAGSIAACGRPKPSVPATTTTTNVTAARDAAIIAGWKAAVEAIDTASRTNDWQSPAVAATHMNPQLGLVQASLQADARQNLVAVGTDAVLSVRIAQAVGDTATVIGCLDGNEIQVDSTTGQPAPGVGGQRGQELVTSTMQETVTGWKVSQETVSEQTCAS